VPAVALKVAEVAAAATVTLEGTVKLALPLDKETLTPPLGAAALRVTVQEEEVPAVLNEVGEQATDDTVGSAPPVTTPPAAVTPT
jgi:hypothetical protein